MTDGRTDGRTDGGTDGGDCNIPDAFLKKRGDNEYDQQMPQSQIKAIGKVRHNWRIESSLGCT